MARTHKWFGTANDAGLIVAWLRDAGATRIAGGALDYDGTTDGREFAIHFPSIGPVEFWPDDISVPKYGSAPKFGDNNPRWKRAILAKIEQERHPEKPQIDPDRSAIAGLRLPEFRDGRYWVAGEIWFPTASLQDTFPQLNRICQRLERFLAKYSTVFDNRKGEDKSGFDYQLCMSGAVLKVVALTEAYELLRGGAFMVDPRASEKYYKDFRRRLQLSGHES